MASKRWFIILTARSSKVRCSMYRWLGVQNLSNRLPVPVSRFCAGECLRPSDFVASAGGPSRCWRMTFRSGCISLKGLTLSTAAPFTWCQAVFDLRLLGIHCNTRGVRLLRVGNKSFDIVGRSLNRDPQGSENDYSANRILNHHNDAGCAPLGADG